MPIWNCDFRKRSNVNDSSPGSLREAIVIAPTDSTIRFAEELAWQLITLTS